MQGITWAIKSVIFNGGIFQRIEIKIWCDKRYEISVLYCNFLFFMVIPVRREKYRKEVFAQEYGSSIGRHFTWDEADSVKQKAAYFC